MADRSGSDVSARVTELAVEQFESALAVPLTNLAAMHYTKAMISGDLI